MSGCAPFTGYADDPATDTSLPAELQDGFGQKLMDEYIQAVDPNVRRAARDKIIYRQLAAYDREFESFERSLAQNNNVFSLTADTTVLALSGAGAVVASSLAKSAFAAATAFITGTKSSVDKDLFYQTTLPALIAQMQAKRLEAKVPIVQGLSESDAEYPLQKALVDLGNLRAAGSITAAINETVQDAGKKADTAKVMINLAPATLQDKQTASQRFSIDQRIRNLSPASVLKMAHDMEPLLQKRPNDIRSRILQYDPRSTRLANPAAARQVLLVWRSYDLTDAASISQWTDELDHLEKP